VRTSSTLALLAASIVAACGRGGASASARPSAPAGAASRDLVYERTVGGNQDLYLIPAGGGVERRLTDHAATDALPRWSRDGKWIYFTSERSGNWQIYRVPPAGGEPERVRTNRFTEWQVEPSPDGKRIAFLSNQEGPEYLYVMNLANGNERVLARHGNSTIMGNPSWSPDGSKLVFSSNWRIGHQIYMVNADGTGERRLTRFRRGGCEPRFHPDGRHVIYVSRGHLSENSRPTEIDLETGEEKALVEWPALNYNPVYSPDATEIAFTSNITGDWVLYRQRLRDGQSWRVTYGAGPARSPDYRP
jgi:Tol biopolymer transport system component